MSATPVLTSIVAWLRAGYPCGVPEQDYIPLLALLSRRLTSDEVVAVARELGRQGDPIETADIATLITKVTNELPRREDVERVRKHVALAGPFL